MITDEEKNRRIKALTEDIKTYEQILANNPNDELAKDILNFKKHQLNDLTNTLTEEDLSDEQRFNDMLLIQKEEFEGLDTSENKKIRNLVICFNGEKSVWEVKYQIDDIEKQRVYQYNDLFIKTCNSSYKKLSDRYGKKVAKEYDEILYGLLNEIDIDLGSKLSSEYLNNNETYKVLYDFRTVPLNIKLYRKIRKSYKNNAKRKNFYIINENTQENAQIYKSIMTLPKIEHIKKIKLDLLEEASYVSPMLNSQKEKLVIPEIGPISTEEELNEKIKKADLESKKEVVEEKKEIKEKQKVIKLRMPNISEFMEEENTKKDLNNLKTQLENLKSTNFDNFLSENDEEIEVLDGTKNKSLKEILSEDDEEIEVLDTNISRKAA